MTIVADLNEESMIMAAIMALSFGKLILGRPINMPRDFIMKNLEKNRRNYRTLLSFQAKDGRNRAC